MTDWVTVVITGIGAQGDGQAEHDGKAVFCPGTLPGDTVKVMLGKPGKYGHSVEAFDIIDQGDSHIIPPCRHFGKCGGCSLQHMNKAAYQNWLTSRMLDPLDRLGISPETLLAPLITPPATRRRISLKLRRLGKTSQLGFLATGSHSIVPVQECPVTHPDLVALFRPLRDGLGPYVKAKGQAEITLTLASNGVDMVVSGLKEPDLAFREWGADFCEKHDIASFHLDDGYGLDPVLIRRDPVMQFAGVSVDLPPASFTQATKMGEEALAAFAGQNLTAGDRVLDLFAGLGTLSVPMAKQGANVIAVDAAKAPLVKLKTAAGRHGLALRVIHRDLFRQPLDVDQLNKVSRVVLDPPRAGAEMQMQSLARSGVPQVVSISCNPATFARDARILADGGYRLKVLQGVDQFLWSPHLEVAGYFEKE